MKKIFEYLKHVGLACLLGALFGMPFLLAPILVFGDNPPATIPARLEWVRATNWQESFPQFVVYGYPGEINPNPWRHVETGLVQSNLVATLSWKGKDYGIVLETVWIGVLSRFYTIVTNRVYEP